MICPKCNAENRDGAKFCDECGARLTDSEHGQDVPVAQNESLEASEPSEVADASGIESQDTGVLHLPEISLDAPCRPSEEPEAAGDAQTGDEEAANPSDDAFDFDPVDSAHASSDSEEKASVSEAADTRRLDLSGFDEYAPAGTYAIPSASWRDGGTMKMPRIEEDASADEQKSFRAPDKKKNGRKGLRIALIAVLIVAACAGIAAFVTYQMELWGGKIVPDVVGMTQADATNTLESKGFAVRATQVKSDETEGVVLLMDPGSNSRLEEGQEVVIHVATARIIPEILGVQRADAEAAMQAEGFNNVTYATQRSDVTEGSVLSVDPAPGEKAHANTAITVVVAEPFTVPAIAGMTQDEAKAALEEAGYTSRIDYVYNEEVEEGTVLGSDPGEGEKVPSGSEIGIQVALSRATELINCTYDIFSEGNTVVIDGVNYTVDSCDDVSYEGDDTTSYSITATPFTYFLGVYLPLDARTVAGTITWTSGNDISSGSPSISLG